MILTVLVIGAATMIYPLLLMLTGSVNSETDIIWNTPLPAYLWDDEILWMKYVESKYSAALLAQAAHRRQIERWQAIRPPEIPDRQLVDDFIEFRETVAWPREWYNLGHVQSRSVLAKNGRLFRKLCQERYADVAAFSHDMGIAYRSWSQVMAPEVVLANRRFAFPDTVNFRIFYDLKASAPREDWVPVDLDGDFLQTFVWAQWATIKDYNAAHNTRHTDYSQVLLSTHPPAPGLLGFFQLVLPEPLQRFGQSRLDWETYVRDQLNLAYIRVDRSATGAFRAYLRKAYNNEINDLNTAWQSEYASFDRIELPAGLPGKAREQADLSGFVKSRNACPTDALSIYSPRQGFEEFLARKRGLTLAAVTPTPMPVEQVDYLDFQRIKPALRWEFLKRNYLHVLDYVLLHGNGVRNTVIFCALMIGTQLLINPLAAYALSRYKPPSQYSILLFCMCTMAFPAEVTMIPSFLMLKRFPLYSLAAGMIASFAAVWLLHKLRPAWPEWIKGVVGIGIGIAAGYWGAPWLANLVLGRPDSTVSLLNTFWAIVLPGMANGFSIFLLKGFFDSLPRELYEAADIDGAGEWTKFWLITMNLSKPILAVMALGAFTAAYSEFMMALVIIPDQSMWTIMVWLFQLQQGGVHASVIYASLVIAAIPTFAVFLFCQNLIMRGIVVPTEK